MEIPYQESLVWNDEMVVYRLQKGVCVYIYTYIYMVYHIQLVIKPNWSDAITQSGQLSSTFFNTSNGSSFIENFFNLLLCIIREKNEKKKKVTKRTLVGGWTNPFEK